VKKTFVISGKVSRFSGKGGWFYISVPKKYTLKLKDQRKTWGMYPIIVRINKTSWNTKLMMKKGGDYFVALNKEIRDIENIVEGKIIKAKLTLI
jgi:hypothetical protein